MREISRSVTGKYKPGIPLNILKGGRGSGGHPLIFHCHCWNVLANCFHGNNFFFSTSLLLLVVVKDEIQFNLACLQVHEGHNRDLKKKNAKMHSVMDWNSAVRICRSLPVLLSRLFLSFRLTNCFFIYGCESTTLMSWYTTDGRALLKHFALTHVYQIKGFGSPCVSVESSSSSAGISSFITVLSTHFLMTVWSLQCLFPTHFNLQFMLIQWPWGAIRSFVSNELFWYMGMGHFINGSL